MYLLPTLIPVAPPLRLHAPSAQGFALSVHRLVPPLMVLAFPPEGFTRPSLALSPPSQRVAPHPERLAPRSAALALYFRVHLEYSRDYTLEFCSPSFHLTDETLR